MLSVESRKMVCVAGFTSRSSIVYFRESVKMFVSLKSPFQGKVTSDESKRSTADLKQNSTA